MEIRRRSTNRRARKPWARSRIRVYCPTCGEVRGNERYGFPAEHDERRVFSHTRNGGINCKGGPVDIVKDRAP